MKIIILTNWFHKISDMNLRPEFILVFQPFPYYLIFSNYYKFRTLRA